MQVRRPLGLISPCHRLVEGAVDHSFQRQRVGSIQQVIILIDWWIRIKSKTLKASWSRHPRRHSSEAYNLKFVRKKCAVHVLCQSFSLVHPNASCWIRPSSRL